MRHLRQVRDDWMAIDILPESKRNPSFRLLPFFGFEEVPHGDLGLDQVWDLHTDRAFAGDGRQNVDPFGLESGRDIVVERSNFLELYAGRGMQFVTSNGRAFGNISKSDFNLKLGQRVF